MKIKVNLEFIYIYKTSQIAYKNFLMQQLKLQMTPPLWQKVKRNSKAS